MMGSSSSHMWGCAAAVFHEGNMGMARVHNRSTGAWSESQTGAWPEVQKQLIQKKSSEKEFRKKKKCREEVL